MSAADRSAVAPNPVAPSPSPVVRFGVTLFVSASLLFCVEPMVAKMLMPLLGGAPAVWITCMLFFQAALLLGYAYAHASTLWLGVRKQAVLHLVVLALPLLVLPIHIRASAATLLGAGEKPVLPLLLVLTMVVGLPFFVVGATAPLVQKWFSRVGDEAGADPYFLYGASNLGSLLALAAYPALIEPWLGISLQTRVWAWGYGALALLVGSCAVTTYRRARPESDTESLVPLILPEVADLSLPVSAPVTAARRLRWVAYAFVPSSLLLGVTAYITTDVAPIPLFWVVPLALYLTTFIFVFARRPPVRHALLVRIMPFGITATVMMLLVQASTPMPLILSVHLASFFVAAMVCHGELARDRPDTRHLTEFYLWVSVGGVLGGVANGLIAPWVFDRLAEYPIAIVLAAACRRVATESSAPTRKDWAFAAAILVLTLVVVAVGNALHLDPTGHYFALLFTFPLFATYSQLEHPARYALAIAATLLGGGSYDASVGRTLHIERNFFGVVRVTRDMDGRFMQIAHGNTIHGRQRLDAAHRDDPASYYTRVGPVGQVFDELHAHEQLEGETGNVGIIGLGAGGMASYAAPSERWTFFEINPVVVRIASNPEYFTFLRDAFSDDSGPKARLKLVVGDARLRIGDVDDGAYDLLVLDAFSSDAIPAHLLTREAFALYRRKLSRHGFLVVHISNRYLDLQPVLANLATDAGLTGFIRRDRTRPEVGAEEMGWTPSIWTVLVQAGDPADVLTHDARWERFAPGQGPPWTDDFSDLVRAFHW
jgi:hypothetical protein